MKLTLIDSDNVTGQLVDAVSMEDIASLVIKHTWSAGVFKDNYRNKNNFLYCDIIGLDFDSNVTLNWAIDTFKEYKHIIATTKSHQKEKNGVICDRFRVILKLKYPIKTQEEFTATYLELMKLWPTDPACKDASRQYFPCVEVIAGNNEGLEIQPIEKLPLNNRTKKFLTNGAPNGQWNTELVQAVKNMQQQEYTTEDIMLAVSNVTGHLDEKDVNSIKYLVSKEPDYETQLAEKDDDILKYIEKWIKHNRLRMTYEGITYLGDREVPIDKIIGKMKMAAYLEGVRYPMFIFESKFDDWYYNCEMDIINKYRTKIAFDPSVSFDWNAFLQVLTGEIRELDKAIFKHFIWQVKRKLHGLPVVWHIMPILVGKTGGGKSYVLAQILKVIEDLTIQKDFKALDDEREVSLLSKYFVVAFEELAGADKVSVESVKRFITADRVSYRKLGTHLQITSSNKATFIGTSNNDVMDAIHDPTSARRYFQIDCVVIKENKYDIVNNLNYLDMWKEIDETKDSPIMPHLKAVFDAQEGIRAKSSLEEWLQFRVESSDDARMSADDAYTDYVEWMDKQGRRKKLGMSKFFRELAKTIDKVQVKGYTKYKLKFKGGFIPGSPL